MTDIYSTALGRALASCGADPAVSWEKFLSRAAWELFHTAPKGYAECALLLVPCDGPFIMGRSHARNKLAAENIFGLLVESSGREIALRVRDHARDSFRFLDESIRSSIILRLDVISRLPWCRDGVLWLGLPTVANPHVVAEAERMGKAFSEWLEIYAPVLSAFREMRTEIRNLESDGRHFRSLAHDARGPLSAIRYVVSEMMEQSPSDDMRALSEQMTYLEQLMESFNQSAVPRELPEGQEGSVRDVCARVCKRYVTVVAQAPLSVRFQEEPGVAAAHEGVWSTMSSLHLERVLSNMVGNAVRHTSSGVVTITLRTTKHQVYLSVRDSGAGMPAERVAELNGEALSGVTSSHGWGLGIFFCKERVWEAGGNLRFSSKEGEGTTVEISLPRAHRQDNDESSATEPSIVSSVSPEVPQAQLEPAPISAATESEEETLVPANNDPLPEEVEQKAVENPAPEIEQPKEVAESVVELILVDDDTDQLLSVARAFSVKKIPTRTFESVSAALDYLRSVALNPQGKVAVLCDTHMPDGGSERLLQELKSSGLVMNVAVASGDLDEDTLYRLAALGAQAFFAKPIELKDVLGWLAKLDSK